MNDICKRILQKKTENKMTWDELCKKAKIGLASWMCGMDGTPTESEIKKIAKVLGTSARWIKNEKSKDC